MKRKALRECHWYTLYKKPTITERPYINVCVSKSFNLYNGLALIKMLTVPNHHKTHQTRKSCTFLQRKIPNNFIPIPPQIISHRSTLANCQSIKWLGEQPSTSPYHSPYETETPPDFLSPQPNSNRLQNRPTPS